MKIEIRSDCTYIHTLYVNGLPTVQRESLTVCANIKHALEHPELWEPTECYQVADSIREHLGVAQ